jgi:hypothetical protein
MALTITIPGAVEATIGATAPAVLTIGVGTPGATGPAGAAGSPGVGVPVGGTAGQFLTKIDGTNYNTDWTTVNLSAYAVKANNLSDLASASTARTNLGLGTMATATASDYSTTTVANGLYYPLSGNPSAFLTASALTGYATESWVTSGFATTSRGQPTSGTVGQVLTKNSGTNYDSSWATLIPGDRYLTSSTTSNTISNGAKTFTVGTGLSYSSQQDVVIAYDASNHMHALVTSYNSGTGELVVDVQHHTGSGTYAVWTVNVGGTTPLQSVEWGEILGTLGDQSDLATALNAKLETSTAASTYAALAGATFTGEVVTPASTTSTAGLTITPGVAPTSPTNGEIWATTNDLQVRLNGATETLAEQSWVTGLGYITSSALTPYAPLAGATFTGLVGTVASTTASAGLNVPHGVAPTSPVNGDIWTTTGGVFARINAGTTQLMNLGSTQTVSGSITFSNANQTLGNSTAASTINVGIGATLTATVKNVNIGTGGVAGSTTITTIGPVNGASTTSIGGTTLASTINLAAGATATATTKAVNIGTGGLAGSTTNIAIGSTTGTSTTTLQGTTTFAGPITGAVNNISLGSGTAAQIMDFATGVTASGLTKAVSIGTGAAAGSTTTIAIGGTAGTSTTTLNGTTNGVTAAADTNSVALATTAFVVGQAGSATPIVNGTAAVGTSLRYARQDHVHPTDTSRAALASPTFTGTPLSTTAAADTNTTQIATTAYVVGQASSTAPVIDGTATVGTSLKYARADHVHPTDTSRAALASPTFTGTPLSTTAAVDTNTTQIATTAYVIGQGYAKLASPTFSGTPSLPTGTTAITQTAGNNTTALATTAFVTAAVPVAATIDQVRTGSSTTTSINPSNLQAAMMSSDIMPVYRFGFTTTTSGTGASSTLGYTNTSLQLPTTGATSGYSYARTFGLSQIDQLTNLWGDDANIYINFAKRIWISGRSLTTFPTTAGYVLRVSFGKQESSGVGDLAVRGIGWKYTTGASQFVQLMVHNGTTLTTVNSSFTPSTVAFDWDVVSDGAGNVTLYINGASVATTSAGPSTRAVSTQNLYQEEAVVSGTIPNDYCRFYCARGSIFVQR